MGKKAEVFRYSIVVSYNYNSYIIVYKKIKVMEGKLEIVGLYEYDDEYQVIDSNRTVWFQGRKADCKKYIKKNK